MRCRLFQPYFSLKESISIRKSNTVWYTNKLKRGLRAEQVPCEKRNTYAFFRHASLEDVSLCLKAEDPNARNDSGRTPLHYAAQCETLAIVLALANAGTDLNARDVEGGWTPLHMAACFSKTLSVAAAAKAGKTRWYYAKFNTVLKGTPPYCRLNKERVE